MLCVTWRKIISGISNITKCQGTRKMCLLEQGFVISGFYSIHMIKSLLIVSWVSTYMYWHSMACLPKLIDTRSTVDWKDDRVSIKCWLRVSVEGLDRQSVDASGKHDPWNRMGWNPDWVFYACSSSPQGLHVFGQRWPNRLMLDTLDELKKQEVQYDCVHTFKFK